MAGVELEDIPSKFLAKLTVYTVNICKGAGRLETEEVQGARESRGMYRALLDQLFR